MPRRSTETGHRPRYTLRSLFMVGLVAALPLILLANFRLANFRGITNRPDDFLASPMLLMAGVFGVLFSAAIGSALGGWRGASAAAVVAGVAWISGMLAISDENRVVANQVPPHIVAASVTVLATVITAFWRRNDALCDPSDTLDQLRAARDQHRSSGGAARDRAAGAADSVESRAASSPDE
ncbi:MAG: hypothetical protein QGG36_19555 [Pirellulaceae bacterium]|jgi:hypothetical protein|nr:hypothetical protein [Pirellulaceae bacterium]MDP7018010.1 hypothetical protein [Pirellulaceae bacterium]